MDRTHRNVIPSDYNVQMAQQCAARGEEPFQPRFFYDTEGLGGFNQSLSQNVLDGAGQDSYTESLSSLQTTPIGARIDDIDRSLGAVALSPNRKRDSNVNVQGTNITQTDKRVYNEPLLHRIQPLGSLGPNIPPFPGGRQMPNDNTHTPLNSPSHDTIDDNSELNRDNSSNDQTEGNGARPKEGPRQRIEIVSTDEDQSENHDDTIASTVKTVPQVNPTSYLVNDECD